MPKTVDIENTYTIEIDIPKDQITRQDKDEIRGKLKALWVYAYIYTTSGENLKNRDEAIQNIKELYEMIINIAGKTGSILVLTIFKESIIDITQPFTKGEVARSKKIPPSVHSPKLKNNEIQTKPLEGSGPFVVELIGLLSSIKVDELHRNEPAAIKLSAFG